MATAAAAVLADGDLAALVAAHLHDAVDLAREDRPPRLPALLGVSRAARAATQRALRAAGYATVACGGLAYVLVPHAPPAWAWASDGDDEDEGPPAPRPVPAELPLAWRVRLRDGGSAVGHVHPVDALWAGVLGAAAGAGRWRALRAAAADALRYALGDAAATPGDFCALLSDDLDLEDAADVDAFVAAHVAPLEGLLAHARAARAACLAGSRRRGAARLGVVAYAAAARPRRRAAR